MRLINGCACLNTLFYLIFVTFLVLIVCFTQKTVMKGDIPRCSSPRCTVSHGSPVSESIGHFLVALNLIVKARLSAKFLSFIHMQTKLLFIIIIY